VKSHYLLLLSILLLSACAHQPNIHFQQADTAKRSDYQTFNIASLPLKGHTHIANEKIELAIRTHLEQAGMSYSAQDSQMTVQYALGIKKIQNVDLKPISIGTGVYTSHLVRDETYATLVINIRDNAQQENIWRMSGSRRVDDEQLPQETFNKKFSEILENFL
jgi:hypothetical protein